MSVTRCHFLCFSCFVLVCCFLFWFFFSLFFVPLFFATIFVITSDDSLNNSIKKKRIARQKERQHLKAVSRRPSFLTCYIPISFLLFSKKDDLF